MFPKRICIVWFQGEDHLVANRPIFAQNVKNWRLLNPDWEVVVMDDAALRKVCYAYSTECGETYDRFELMHLKIDFARYVVLWETCGMYVDMDCFAFRSLSDSTLLNQFFEKYTPSTHLLGLSETSVNWFERAVSELEVNNGIMIASPHNPAIARLIAFVVDKARSYQPGSLLDNRYLTITSITGPKMLNEFVRDGHASNNDANVHIERFPYYVFEPGQPFQKYDVRDETVALHRFELSWLTPTMKHCLKGYYTVCKPYFLFALFAVLILYAIYKYYRTDCKQRCEVWTRKGSKNW